MRGSGCNSPRLGDVAESRPAARQGAHLASPGGCQAWPAAPALYCPLVASLGQGQVGLARDLRRPPALPEPAGRRGSLGPGRGRGSWPADAGGGASAGRTFRRCSGHLCRGLGTETRGKMAAPWWQTVLRGSRRWRGLSTSAALSRRTAPLGPMPNEDIDVSNLERLEKYRSFDRYRRRAESEARKPHWWRTYREYFGKEPDPKDKVDIGLPPPTVCRTQQLLERRRFLRELRANVEEERAARLRTACIPLEAVQAEWEKTCGPYHKQRLAEYYGLYRDLFHGSTFVPRVPLHVAYAMGEDNLMPVYQGNEVTPTEAAQAPEVTYEADEGSLWTLLLTNLDGHLLEPDAEYIHWLLTNIPGNRVADGQETCPYLPPFPARGSGFHRFVFLLFKQDKPVDFSGDTRPSPCYQLAQRTFHTFDFYKKHQEAMTPAGLAFFQCRWDDSVTHVFHQLLDMREPVFEFVRPPPYHPKQKRFPHRQPLRYLDRYRDSHEPTYGIY